MYVHAVKFDDARSGYFAACSVLFYFCSRQYRTDVWYGTAEQSGSPSKKYNTLHRSLLDDSRKTTPVQIRRQGDGRNTFSWHQRHQVATSEQTTSRRDLRLKRHLERGAVAVFPVLEGTGVGHPPPRSPENIDGQPGVYRTRRSHPATVIPARDQHRNLVPPAAAAPPVGPPARSTGTGTSKQQSRGTQGRHSA